MRYKKEINSIKQMVVTIEDRNAKKLSELEKRIKVLECGQTGHQFGAYRRGVGWGYFTLWATCSECGYSKTFLLSGLSPSRKAALIELGILYKSDFPKKKGTKTNE